MGVGVGGVSEITPGTVQCLVDESRGIRLHSSLIVLLQVLA